MAPIGVGKFLVTASEPDVTGFRRGFNGSTQASAGLHGSGQSHSNLSLKFCFI